VRRLTTLAMVVVLAAGVGACSKKHGAKNVYSCPDKGPGVDFSAVKKGKLTVKADVPAPTWWEGTDVETLTGGYEFELAKDLCAQLGIGRVRIVDARRADIAAGKATDFDVALAEIAITDATSKVDFSTPYVTSDGQQFAVVLPKGSANTKLVNTAIAKLKAAGTLDALSKKWLNSTS
jgi:polar amino acid transport system substrate-binding protein